MVNRKDFDYLVSRLRRLARDLVVREQWSTDSTKRSMTYEECLEYFLDMFEADMSTELHLEARKKMLVTRKITGRAFPGHHNFMCRCCSSVLPGELEFVDCSPHLCKMCLKIPEGVRAKMIDDPVYCREIVSSYRKIFCDGE